MRHSTVKSCGLLLCSTLVNCGDTTVEVNGTSTLQVTVPSGTRIKVPGGTKWKTKDGVEVVIEEPGVIIESPPGGGTVTIKDRIVSSGQSAQNQQSGDVIGHGNLAIGSNYEFKLPELLGEYPSAPVPLVGSYSYVATQGALLPGPNGGQVLNPAGVLNFNYFVSGAAPTWQLPLYNTPLGDFEGERPIEADPFSVVFNGNIGGLSGTMMGGNFTLSIPVELTMDGHSGMGNEIETGTIELVP